MTEENILITEKSYINCKTKGFFFSVGIDKETKNLIFLPALIGLVCGKIGLELNQLLRFSFTTITILISLTLIFISYILVISIIRIILPLIKIKSINKTLKEMRFNVGIYLFKKSKVLEEETKRKNYKIHSNIEKVNYYYNIKRLKFYLLILSVIGLAIISGISIMFKDSKLFSTTFIIIIAIGILTTIFSFLISKSFPNFSWDNKNQIRNDYLDTINKVKRFKVILNTNIRYSLQLQNLKDYDCFPSYFYLITNQDILTYELELWKKYLNFTLIFNKITSLECILWLLENKKENFQKHEWKVILLKIKNLLNMIYSHEFENNEFIFKYKELVFYINSNVKNSYKFSQILIILDKLNITFYRDISFNEKIVIDERDVDFNLFQFHYLEYLYSIISKL